jgi:hypothetical protein
MKPAVREKRLWKQESYLVWVIGYISGVRIDGDFDVVFGFFLALDDLLDVLRCSWCKKLLPRFFTHSRRLLLDDVKSTAVLQHVGHLGFGQGFCPITSFPHGPPLGAFHSGPVCLLPQGRRLSHRAYLW